MFLVRIAFWLIIIVLLLPTDGKQQSEVYGTAQAAVKDVSGFCDRNPDACVKGMNIFNMLVQKAQFGAGMLVGFVQEQAAGSETVQTEALAPGPLAPDAFAAEPLEPQPTPATGPDPISWDPAEDGRSQNTLRSEDLEAQWGGEASDPGV
jgi:hypothetical protein